MAKAISTSCLLAVALLVGCTERSESSAGPDRVMHPISSPQWPDPIGRIPLPRDWTFDAEHEPGAATITGPDGLRVTDVPPAMFMFARDPGMRRAYRKAGQKVRRFRSMDDVVKKDLVPMAKEGGNR
ncbi:MAG: hypothetical protein AAF997_22040, partial [Myxococcota bacterium]